MKRSKAIGVCVIVDMSPRRAADMVADYALVRDVYSEAFSSESDAQIHVLHPVFVAFVEAIHLRENRSFDEQASGGGGIAFLPIALGNSSARFPGVGGHALQIEEYARMVDEAGFVIHLNVPDGPDLGKSLRQFEHRFQPSWKKFQVVVDQDQVVACSPLSSSIIRFGKAEVAIVAKNDESIGKAVQKARGFWVRSVVYYDQLVSGEIDSRFQRAEGRLGQIQAVSNGNYKRDPWLRHAKLTLNQRSRSFRWRASSLRKGVPSSSQIRYAFSAREAA